MDFYKRFWEFVRLKKLFEEHQPVLLAVSGGLDSMALLHLMSKRHKRLAVAHCNFQLRGGESDGDAAFVQASTTALGIPYFEKTFDTDQYASENGLSTQMAARHLRYYWFETLCAENGYELIGTAHHLDDHVETAWLHLIRGTGLRGLAGMPLVNGRVVRPLMFAARADIEAYAAQENVSWREDSSNAEDHYARNMVRHHLLPTAKTLNPNLLSTSTRSMERLREAADNLEFLVGRHLPAQTDASGNMRWDKAALELLPGRVQALTILFQPFGFDEEQMRQLAEGWADTGKQWTAPGGARLLNDRHHLILETAHPQGNMRIRVEADDLMVRLPNGTALFTMPAEPGMAMPDGRTAVAVPAEALVFPLYVRPWTAGDAFQPFGMGGKRQKLQDFLTNLKLSRIEKEHTLVLENGNGEIIWVVGYRMDERYRVGEGGVVVFRVVH
ncbi:MAG: tRNA lysidine(34) synthetase TilS [Saprospiraceae bacterium]